MDALFFDIYWENLEFLEASLTTIGCPFSELGPLESNLQALAHWASRKLTIKFQAFWPKTQLFCGFVSAVLSLTSWDNLLVPPGLFLGPVLSPRSKDGCSCSVCLAFHMFGWIRDFQVCYVWNWNPHEHSFVLGHVKAFGEDFRYL